MSSVLTLANRFVDRAEAFVPRVFDATALRAYANKELERAITLLAYRGGRVHEGVHQARKSLRRSRSVLALGAVVLGPGAQLIDSEVRRLNRALSAVRDAQATVEVLDRLLKKSQESADVVVLRRARRMAAMARVESARRELADDPHFEQKRLLLGALRAALLALPWDRLTETRVRDALSEGLARVDAADAQARVTGRDKDWHRWRRRVRRLSQQHRALGDLLDLPARKRVKTLAEDLGEAQDYALLREHCGRRSIFSEPDRHVLRAMADAGSERVRGRIQRATGESPPVNAGA